MRSPEISVILPTRGRFVPVLAAVSGLARQREADLEILVGDQNESWPVGYRRRRDEVLGDSRIRWLAFEPEGVVRVRNRMVERARGRILLFVDDDVVIPDVYFARKHRDVYANGWISAVCGREISRARFRELRRRGEWLEEATDEREIDRAEAVQNPVKRLLAFDRSAGGSPRAAPVWTTGNGSIRRKDFIQLGGFDEGFQGASYGDDADLALRLWECGKAIVYHPGPWLVHMWSPYGGLRLSAERLSFTETDKSVSGWLFLLRHGTTGVRWRLFHGWVLRRTLLLRRNLTRPWRQPRVAAGLALGFFHAWRAWRSGPTSIFSREECVGGAAGEGAAAGMKA